MYIECEREREIGGVLHEQKKKFYLFCVCVIICIFLALDLCNPNKKGALNVSAQATDIHGNKSDIKPAKRSEEVKKK